MDSHCEANHRIIESDVCYSALRSECSSAICSSRGAQKISPPRAHFEREIDDRPDPGVFRLVTFLDECIDLFVLKPDIAFVVDDRPFHILGVDGIRQEPQLALAVIDNALEDLDFSAAREASPGRLSVTSLMYVLMVSPNVVRSPPDRSTKMPRSICD